MNYCFTIINKNMKTELRFVLNNSLSFKKIYNNKTTTLNLTQFTIISKKEYKVKKITVFEKKVVC